MDSIVGKRFNYLTIELIYKKKENYNLMVRCRCDCGNKKKMRLDNVKRGKSKSCGCQEGNINSEQQKQYKQKWVNQKKPSKKNLAKLYLNDKMSLRDISAELNIPNPTIWRWMQEYEIPSRKPGKPLSKETKILKSIRT